MDGNSFQRGADTVIQKSLREGFGLVLSEALWKGRPVIAGRAGGTPMQFPERYDGYLVANVEGLLDDTEEKRSLGEAGSERVRRKFLLRRLMRDELKLVKEIIGSIWASVAPRLRFLRP